jgi:microcystin-dependent protein
MDFYIGQIGIFGFNFAPTGWAQCTGSILPIQQNAALFSLIGTTYGGNGTSTFALPDLRSRAVMGYGPQTSMGEIAGVENVTLLSNQMPAHNHSMQVSNSLAQDATPAQRVFAEAAHASAATPGYAPTNANVTLSPQTISLNGGNTPHSNLQPYLAVNFCIATTGYFPPRS